MRVKNQELFLDYGKYPRPPRIKVVYILDSVNRKYKLLLHRDLGHQISSQNFEGRWCVYLNKNLSVASKELEAANYQMKKEIIKKLHAWQHCHLVVIGIQCSGFLSLNVGGQLAAINLESRAALLAAKQGFVGAASRYLGFRSMMSLLGPM